MDYDVVVVGGGAAGPGRYWLTGRRLLGITRLMEKILKLLGSGKKI